MIFILCEKFDSMHMNKKLKNIFYVNKIFLESGMKNNIILQSIESISDSR